MSDLRYVDLAAADPTLQRLEALRERMLADVPGVERAAITGAGHALGESMLTGQPIVLPRPGAER